MERTSNIGVTTRAFLIENFDMQVTVIRVALLLACGVCQIAHADNWQPLTGAATLQAFVSGATAEIQNQTWSL